MPYEKKIANQVPFQDYRLVVPQHWLLRKLACVNFCHRVLGINRNERLHASTKAIVESGSFCGMFGRLRLPAKGQL